VVPKTSLWSYKRVDPKRVLILGGTGFVGRSLIARLARQGHSITVPTRHRHRHRDLAVIPNLKLVEADVHNPDALMTLLTEIDVVINLVGILFETRQQTFQRNHTDLVKTLVHAMEHTGVHRLIAMSSLGARIDGPSAYLRSKGQAEAIIRASRLHYTILKPSVIYGPGDNFLNQFARLLALAPVLPLARTHTRFAPCFIEDVVSALTHCLTDPSTLAQTYELGGPEVFTLKELVLTVARFKGWQRTILSLPDALGYCQACALEWLPTPPLTRDNFASLSEDSVPSDDGFGRLGVKTARLTHVVPRYLSH